MKTLLAIDHRSVFAAKIVDKETPVRRHVKNSMLAMYRFVLKDDVVVLAAAYPYIRRSNRNTL